MNILEKILEELEALHNKILKDKFAERVTEQEIDSLIRAKDIFRSHMDEAKDINVPSKDGWIDRKNLKEEIKSLRFTITGMRNGKTMTKLALEEYRKTILKIIDEQLTYMDDGWIPVEERLPEEKTEVLVCFKDGIVQSLWQNWKNDGLGDYFDDDLMPTQAIAWQPLPEPYRPKEKDNVEVE